jgi:hypothetical protein
MLENYRESLTSKMPNFDMFFGSSTNVMDLIFKNYKTISIDIFNKNIFLNNNLLKILFNKLKKNIYIKKSNNIRIVNLKNKKLSIFLN